MAVSSPQLPARGYTQQGRTAASLWYSIPAAHDFELHVSGQALISTIFTSHLTQLAILLFWAASHLFHIAWLGNLSVHAIRDPHFGAIAMFHIAWLGNCPHCAASYFYVTSASGLYQWYFTVGMTAESQLLHAASFLCATGACLLVAAYFHSRARFTGSLAASSWQALVNHHLGAMLGTASIAWAGHVVHVALPVSRGAQIDGLAVFTQICHPLSQAPFLDFNWAAYAAQPDGIAHVFGSADASAGSAILTFIGGLLPGAELYLTDLAHHHLAVGIVAVLLGSVANGINFSAGLLPESLHYQLAWALAALGTASSYAAQHIDALPPYAYLDKVSHAGLYTHHQYIAGFFLCGAFAHGAIYLVRDDSFNSPGWFAKLVMQHRAFIISHLSYVSLFLGFHTLGLYVHNDVMQAFACPEKMIGIAPVFAQWIQVAHGNTLGFSISSGDVLVHHGIALGLHVTTLILLKAALNGRSSKLFPDKVAFGYGFPCDGPGRGGTCDISAWDGFYLAVFWMLNTIGWKHIALWTDNLGLFQDSSTYLMGWFRDYLWFNSAQLINGYNPFGFNSLSVWAWTFLLGHLIWATGFMFLISWRGYWQELIESIVWAHEQTPIAGLLVWNKAPVALSIVQARFVGLAHFAVGYVFTYGPFVIASTFGWWIRG